MKETVCSRCFFSYDAIAPGCPVCYPNLGMRIIPEDKKCSSCSKLVKADVIYCTSCGSKFSPANIFPKQTNKVESQPVATTSLYLGGMGSSLSNGAKGSLVLGPQSIYFESENRVLWEAPTATLEKLHVDGAGAFKTGGGWFGGGFGIKGALEGALFATALNAITTRTKYDCIIRMRFEKADVTFQILDRTPRQLQIDLTFLNHILEKSLDSGENNETKSSTSIVQTIKELAELRDLGLISDNEFDKKKSELLKRL